MSGIRSSLRKRLAKLEQERADRARREQLADCNCKDTNTGVTVADNPEKFEAEMNLLCPVHGFRRLGRIIQVVYVRSPGDRDPKMDELVATYKARLAQADEDADAPQEF